MLLLKEKGHELKIAVLTSGECGSHELPAKEIVAIRQKEARKGAGILSADYTCLGIHDGCVSYDLPTAKLLVKLLREYDPGIIFTHPTVDYITDHSHTGRLILWAVPESTHPNFPADTSAPAQANQPAVYHTDPDVLVGPDGQFPPVNTIVDISDIVEKKFQAASAHASQLGFISLKDRKNVLDSNEEVKRWNIARGVQVRVEYAEGFCQQLLEQYPRHNILAEVLGQKVYTP